MNKKNIDLLKKIINKKREKIVLFAGAGISIPLGIKDWGSLLEDMNKKLNTQIDIEKHNYNYPQVAENIYNKLEKMNKEEEYYIFLRNAFDIKKATLRFTSTTKSIVNNFKTVLTTNFDASFEAAIEDTNKILVKYGNSKIDYKIQELPIFSIEELLSNQATIVYLHGNRKGKNFIFRNKEYKAFYCSVDGETPSDLEDFLKNIFLRFTIIFFGFSFDDEYFKKYFEKIITEDYKNKKSRYHELRNEKYPLNLPEHFIIIPSNELKYTLTQDEIENYLQKNNNGINLKSIFRRINNEDYVFCDDFLEIIESININEGFKNELRKKYNSLSNNYLKKTFLDNMKINIIDFNLNGDIPKIEMLFDDLFTKTKSVVRKKENFVQYERTTT